MPAPKTPQAPSRIRIAEPWPQVDGGRYPAKACTGDRVRVEADVLRDGHEALRAVVRARPAGAKDWAETPMAPLDHDRGGLRWVGHADLTSLGRWEVQIEAWADYYASWRDEVRRKLDAAQENLSGELSEGILHLRALLKRAKGEDRAIVQAVLDAAPSDPEALLAAELVAVAERWPDRTRSARLDGALPFQVDVPLARFGSWYELFPRSWGGLKGVTEVVPRIAELGFDVIYLPPLSPIGVTNRKGRNNALVAGPGDPGSPWAIGNGAQGGHDAVHPELGDEDDVRELVRTAREHGVEVAVDYVVTFSADHPWLSEHPEWFLRRPDGTLKYAENPPKKYQDVHNVDWDTPEWKALWEALRDAVLYWVDLGVKVFRVDNPHTKPLAFWEWLIAEVQAVQPELVMLSEAFTKRPLMNALAKVGFQQSYTHFPWQHSTYDLRQFVDSHIAENHILRPAFWTNTPDILTAELVHGGPPAFHSRLILAATLSPAYGIYSGYEHFENVPVREGSEEYLNSEKYEVRERALDGPLLPRIALVNRIRREHPALQRLDTLWWLPTENDALLGYAKAFEGDLVLCVVNVDPHNHQEGVVNVPAELGLPPAFAVTDLLGGEDFHWHLGRNFVRLAPGGAHLLTPIGAR